METNITVADLSSGCHQAVAKPALAQWDRGQILQITGAELPSAYNVEFGVQGMATTITMIGDEDGVEIPNTLLELGETVKAYLVLHAGEDDRETEYWISIFVRQRPQPPDVEPTPEQEGVIDQLIAHLDSAVTGAQEAEASAEQSAAAADSSATLAESWAVGETGTREHEDVDNAKYYAWLASQGAESSGYVWCEVDLQTGALIIHITDNLDEDLDFAVNANLGVLEVTING